MNKFISFMSFFFLVFLFWHSIIVHNLSIILILLLLLSHFNLPLLQATRNDLSSKIDGSSHKYDEIVANSITTKEEVWLDIHNYEVLVFPFLTREV